MERMEKKELEKLKDFKVYAFEGDVYVKAEDYKEIAIENKKLREYTDNLDSENDNQAIEIEELKKENKILKEELKKTNELLSNVARCSEQYRGKMISIMNELKMSLYKD